METKRDLGTVILMPSITKKEEIVGKMCADGNSVECNNRTYPWKVSPNRIICSVGSWINSVMYDYPENETLSNYSV